jgi:hypothetical protein
MVSRGSQKGQDETADMRGPKYSLGHGDISPSPDVPSPPPRHVYARTLLTSQYSH